MASPSVHHPPSDSILDRLEVEMRQNRRLRYKRDLHLNQIDYLHGDNNATELELTVFTPSQRLPAANTIYNVS